MRASGGLRWQGAGSKPSAMHDDPWAVSAKTRLNRRRFLGGAVSTGMGMWLGAGRVGAAERARPPELAFSRTPEALQLNLGPRPVLRYQVLRPSLGGPAVESGCYLHPVHTPAGVAVTEVAPEDHRHHRGIFCGWVEMHGPADADFWGWGEHAPTKGRRIVNETLEAEPPAMGYGRFRAINRWTAGEVTVLREDFRVGAGVRDGATVLDFTVGYQVEREVQLARWAFGGFAVRVRKEGQAVAWGPEGEVKRTPPQHTDPASNWPAAPWYALHLRLPEGKEATVVVVGRHNNPETTWHVVPGIGLINPSITAPAAVTLVPGKTLALRYRVMVFDGAPKLAAIQPMAESWYKGGQA